ncbi:MAG: hypothetical protein ABIB71_07125 [Candidatus Woesearchaeota archaeon]
MSWKTVERPGYAGSQRQQKIAQCDEQYGAGRWRIAWIWKGGIITKNIAFQLYEDAYYTDSFSRKPLWQALLSLASDVYDNSKSNVKSGLDYLVQETEATHLQDISIRRVVMRRGWKFEGEKLIQIRSHADYFGNQLSPGKVPFHIPELIVVPHINGWWDNNSIEDFYQSNKVLQAKE